MEDGNIKIEEKNCPEINVEVTKVFNEENLKEVLSLEKECFPESWQYEDAEDYYKKILSSNKNVNIFLRSNGKAVGYILAKPHDEAISDLVEYDDHIQEDKDKYYIETIQIMPGFRGSGGAKKLLLSACDEVFNKGFNKFSIHARTLNKFNVKVKEIFKGMISSTRPIEKWKPGGDEPYEYIEWVYNK